jgi:hypothetical protein
VLFSGLAHLKTSEVGEVLEHAVRRIERFLDRRGLLGTREDDLDLSGEGDPECNLACSAVAQGQAFASLKGGFALARYLAAAGELTDIPRRSPDRGPPYWKSQVLRRQAVGPKGNDGRGDEAA